MDKACHGAQESLARFQRWINFDVVYSPLRPAAITAWHTGRIKHSLQYFGSDSGVPVEHRPSPIDHLRQAAINHAQPGHLGLWNFRG